MNSRKVDVDKCSGVDGGEYCELGLIQASNVIWSASWRDTLVFWRCVEGEPNLGL